MTTFYGDEAGILDVKAKGQNLVGLNSVNNIIYGDAYTIIDSKGGNDVLTGGTLSFSNDIYGDADSLTNSRGGNDVLIGGQKAQYNYLTGDADSMTNSRGGNDVLTGGKDSMSNFLYGDAFRMQDSLGGNDVLIGGIRSAANYIFGDSYLMTGSRGGNDLILGETAQFKNELYGDTFQMENSSGGNDVVTGASQSLNELYGDALYMTNSQGGNDVLRGGDQHSNNFLYGDAKYYISGNVIGGNDRLISATGNDEMWGDIAIFLIQDQGIDLSQVTTGHDVFVFSASNGADTIHDFHHGEDKIELHGLAADFEALGEHLAGTAADTVITFGSNTITLIGVTELTAADFIFS